MPYPLLQTENTLQVKAPLKQLNLLNVGPQKVRISKRMNLTSSNKVFTLTDGPNSIQKLSLDINKN